MIFRRRRVPKRSGPNELTYAMLYPPEGNSSILEMSAKDQGDFLHVAILSDGTLGFRFFPGEDIMITERQVEEIIERARKNIN